MELSLHHETGGIAYLYEDHWNGTKERGLLWDFAANRLKPDAISSLADRFVPDESSDEQKRNVHGTVTAAILDACKQLHLIHQQLLSAFVGITHPIKDG